MVFHRFQDIVVYLVRVLEFLSFDRGFSDELVSMDLASSLGGSPSELLLDRDNGCPGGQLGEAGARGAPEGAVGCWCLSSARGWNLGDRPVVSVK